jgi:uncharacterized protein
MAKTNLEFTVCLRVHVSPNNFESNISLLKRINKSFGADARFSIHFHKISDLGGANTGNIQTLNEHDYVTMLSQLKQGTDIRSSSEVELVESREICYASKANSLMIRANGRLGKCTVALDDPRNDIGHIKPDGSLQIENESFQRWLNGLTDMDVDTLSCPLSTLAKRGFGGPLEIKVVS